GAGRRGRHGGLRAGGRRHGERAGPALAGLAQQLVDVLEVDFRQDAGGRAQAQSGHDRLVARPGQVAQRGVQLLLGVEDVQVDAHADFVAGAVGGDRGPAGFFARLQGPDARKPRIDASEVAASLLDRLAARVLVFVARLLYALDRLGHAR